MPADYNPITANTNSSTPVSQPANSGAGIAGLVNGSGNIPQFSGALGGAGNVASSTAGFNMTDGWYMAIACGFGIITADTKIGPVVLGILTVGLIYQLTLLIQGK